MTVLGSSLLAGSSGNQGYNLTKSLRFRNSATAYMTRTPASAGNRQKFTLSYWVKPGIISSSSINPIIFSAGNASTRPTATLGAFLAQASNNAYNLQSYNGSGYDYNITTTQVFRDPSSWYHFVIAFDTTQSTASDRIKLYVNGSQITSFSTASYPTQNLQLAINNTVTHGISTNTYNPGSNGDALDGYLAEMNFIDGQQLTPSSFGSTNAQTGVWQPAKYTGTYGTNGFYLPFTDVATTSGSNAGLGKDFSGNGNYWTTNNISVTSGSTYDSMTDVPTLTDASTANYCVLSPIDTYDNPPTEGNLRRTGVGHGGSPWSSCRGTLGVSSGKWYFEATLTGSTGGTSNNMVGIMTTATSTLSDAYGGAVSRSYQANGGMQGDNQTGSVSSASSGDVIMCAFDIDAGKVWFGKNGTWFNSGVPASGTGNVFTSVPTTPVVPALHMYGNTGDNYGWFTNFGQRPFTYTPPTGFVALNTYNLPTPTIGATASTQANDNFDIITWTGTSTSSGRTFTGLNFQPDLVWGKLRSTGGSHQLYDAVRGTGKRLSSNLTDAEATNSANGYVSAFNSDGFTTVAGSTNNGWWNELNSTYVAWNWKANGTGVSNTAGSITSTVSANTSAGFSVFTFNSGSSGTQTVGHGLGAAPAMIVFKDRAGGHWNVWHKAFSNPAQGYMYLNLTNAVGNDASQWSNTAPTSTVFTYNSGYSWTANRDMVAYAWSEVAGYSKAFSYTGNGSTDGPFVHLGFRPKYIMIKRTDSLGDWELLDSSRDTYNPEISLLEANNSDTEAVSSTVAIDFLSNGFKNRNTRTPTNASGGTYVGFAFAENPFKYSLAR